MGTAFNFRFEVEGVPLLVRSFHRVGEDLSDLTPDWDPVTRAVQKFEDENFKSQNTKGASGQWAALSRPYAKQKAQRHGVKTILRATDELYESLTGQTANTVLIKDKQEFAFGTSLSRGKFHQLGTGKMPKRPVIDPSDAQKRDVAKALQGSLLQRMKRDPQIKLEIQE